MVSKCKVLVFIDWFYPAYKAGGPIKSVFNIICALYNEVEFLVITSNIDLDGGLLNVRPNYEIKKSFYKIIYLDKENQSRKVYKKLHENFNPHYVYYNNLFSWKFTLIPYSMFRNNIQVIAPRGMLGKGALAIKPLKKNLFLKLAKLYLKNSKTIWHASTRQEEDEINQILGDKVKVLIAQNLSSKVEKRVLSGEFKKKEELRLIFISRISLKKNLLFLLERLKDLKECLNIKLEIFGPIEDEIYWKKCMWIINSDNRISYSGVVHPDQIDKMLNKSHFFVLPTKHENYGHAVVEAINQGVPVLLSKNTPWLNLAKTSIGFDIPLNDVEQWNQKIKELYELENEDYMNMVKSCYKYSLKNIVSSEVLEQNRNLFSIEYKS